MAVVSTCCKTMLEQLKSSKIKINIYKIPSNKQSHLYRKNVNKSSSKTQTKALLKKKAS